MILKGGILFVDVYLTTENGCFYIQSFSLTECIVIVVVRKTGVACLSVCLCVCVCLWRAVCRNYWADFNQTDPNWSPNGLVVRIYDLAH